MFFGFSSDLGNILNCLLPQQEETIANEWEPYLRRKARNSTYFTPRMLNQYHNIILERSLTPAVLKQKS